MTASEVTGQHPVNPLNHRNLAMAQSRRRCSRRSACSSLRCPGCTEGVPRLLRRSHRQPSRARSCCSHDLRRCDRTINRQETPRTKEATHRCGAHLCGGARGRVCSAGCNGSADWAGVPSPMRLLATTLRAIKRVAPGRLKRCATHHTSAKLHPVTTSTVSHIAILATAERV